MTEKIVLVTDYTWSSTEPEAKILADAGATLLLAETGNEQDGETRSAGGCDSHVLCACDPAGRSSR